MKYFIILFVITSDGPDFHSIEEVPNLTACREMRKEVNGDGTYFSKCIQVKQKSVKFIK